MIGVSADIDEQSTCAHRNASRKRGQRWMIRPEQRGSLLQKDNTYSFSKPGNLVLDAFAITLPAAKAGVLQEMHRNLVAWAKNNRSVGKLMTALVEAHVLSCKGKSRS